jgi:hypothetical protein
MSARGDTFAAHPVSSSLLALLVQSTNTDAGDGTKVQNLTQKLSAREARVQGLVTDTRLGRTQSGDAGLHFVVL